jgi:KDO2-lipid IV(A) lauroyltransferase
MHFLTFILLRALTFPFSFLSYAQLHRVGTFFGNSAFFLFPRFRKRALSNLALATTLALTEKELIQTAKESFQNLMINCLEYAKFSREKDISKVATCLNPEQAENLIKEGKGVIFFCGHQANWEILFLEGTSRMPGVAIGRPIKNHYLYNWVMSIRQKFGGTIITPKNAFKEGMRALKKGCFLGIVGDQGMPDSGFSSSFFGRRAWTSPLPAILAYRSGRPIFVAITKRISGKYAITYSEPIWPNQDEPMEKEIKRMMEASLKHLEDSIRDIPGQWLWQHNRWKQQVPGKVKRTFRHDSIAIILPEETAEFEKTLEILPSLRELYPLEFITLFVPQGKMHSLSEVETHFYSKLEDLLVRDFRFKLIFNFSSYPEVSSHFRSLAAQNTLTTKHISSCLKTVSS